jgi:hypothetical protein
MRLALVHRQTADCRDASSSWGVAVPVDRPSDARDRVRSLTGGSIAILWPALPTRHHDRWPRWVTRLSPKHGCYGVTSVYTVARSY